jgi:hypothetical protein
MMANRILTISSVLALAGALYACGGGDKPAAVPSTPAADTDGGATSTKPEHGPGSGKGDGPGSSDGKGPGDSTHTGPKKDGGT